MCAEVSKPGETLGQALDQTVAIIRINQQWRLCFRWSQGEALDVEIIDYH